VIPHPATRPSEPAVTLPDFESGRIDADQFDHEAHVFVAWRLLGETSLRDALERYSAALRRVTAALGVPGKYHETITWFFVLLIAERRNGCEDDWAAFAAANADLIRAPGGLLSRYYSAARLGSDAARQAFLLPDRAPAQGAGTIR